VGLIDELSPGPVALDTAIFIYLIEEHPKYLPHVLPLFEAADAGRRELLTSGLTLLEVLVVPYRRRNVAVAERYEMLLTWS
jgi:predicted nucleic acid-binding protein